MRSRITRAAILLGFSLALAGCSTTKSSSVAKSSWWPFGSKSKSVPASTSSGLASNAPAGPQVAAHAPPAVTMPQASNSYYNGTQYPVTPYPPATVPASAQTYAAAADPAATGYMPPSDPYANPANPYAAAAATAPPANPYAAPTATTAQASPYAANPYAQAPAQAPAYTAGAAQPYPGGPGGSGDMPYAYTR